MKFFITILSFFAIVSFCIAQNDAHSRLNIHEFVVQEVLQTTSYTYLLAREGDKTQWLALPKLEATIGDTYYYYGGVEMRDFNSSELNRTFNSVLFLGSVENSESLNNMITSESTTNKTQNTSSAQEIIKIESIPGTITISELLSKKNEYEDKVVKIRGRVMKFNKNIMGKNWIHLQDGSKYADEYDITITSEMETKVGEIVTFEGKITLNKDFGSGYFYSIIMEDAKMSILEE